MLELRVSSLGQVPLPTDEEKPAPEDAQVHL
jgi:hypothetical protein